MKQGRSTTTPTPEEAAWLHDLGEIGCIACKIWGIPEKVECERDHMNRGGLAGMPRLGHLFTLGLCVWHHRGEPFPRMSIAECLKRYGPSQHHHKVAFLREFGSFKELLEIQQALVARYRELTRLPWQSVA